MAKIRIKRSNVVTNSVAKAPTASQMDFGELAVNYNTFDPVLFIKDSNNDIIRLTGNNLITSVFGNTGDIVADASDYATFYAPSAHVGTGDSQHAAVTTTANGFMVAGDKAKLDGITAGAQPNVITSWNGRTTSNIVPTVGDYDLTQLGDVNISSPSDGQVISWNSTSSKFEAINQTPVTNLTTSSNSTTVSVNSSTGSNTSIAGATQTNAGLLIATDKTKLDSINTSINETTASGEFKNVKSNWSTTDNTLDSFIKNKPTIPTTLGSLTDVDVSGLGNDKIIKYNSSNSQWELDNLSVATGGTVTSVVAGSGLNGGTISTSGTISINNSYLHSTLDTRYLLASSYVPDDVVASNSNTGASGSNGLMTANMAEKLNIIPNNAQANVQSDYLATSGDAFIKNMPTVPLNLGEFGDVTLSNSQVNQVLQYNGSNWVNSGITLNELSNVSAGSPSSGQILSYNGSNWVPLAAPSGTTNLGTSTSTSNVTITSSTGNNTAIAVATSSRAGVLDTTLFDKLNGIQAGAEVNPTNISAFNNNEGYITSASVPTNNNQLENGAGYVTANQCNTVIGTDNDINTSGATVIDQLNMTDGVITSHSVRTMTLAHLGFSGATNANYVTNNNQLTNGAGYVTSSSVPTNNNQLTNGAGYVTSSGNTVIGTDNDINTSGATVIDQLNMTDGVIISHSVRTMTLADLGYTGATNATRVTNNDQLPNGAGYLAPIINVDVSTSKKLTFTGSGNFAIDSANGIQHNDYLVLTSRNGQSNKTIINMDNGYGFTLSNNNSSNAAGIKYNSSNNYIGWRHVSGTGVQYIYDDTTWFTIQATYSDRRLKKDIEALGTGAINIINRLNPVKFRWADKEPWYTQSQLGVDPEGTFKYGFIAQEVSKVVPEALVIPDITEEDQAPMADYDVRALVAVLTKAVQELSAEVKTMQENK